MSFWWRIKRIEYDPFGRELRQAPQFGRGERARLEKSFKSYYSTDRPSGYIILEHGERYVSR